MGEEEIDRLLLVCRESRSPYLFSIVLLALTTGMRQGEILGLKWADIDFEKGIVILQPFCRH